MLHTNAHTVAFRTLVASGMVPDLTSPPVFASSTPETRPSWAQDGGRWRGAHADILTFVLNAVVGPGFYATSHDDTPSGRKQLWVGHRAQLTRAQRHQLMDLAAAHLRRRGLRVRRQKRDGSTHNLVVTDHLTREQA